MPEYVMMKGEASYGEWRGEKVGGCTVVLWDTGICSLGVVEEGGGCCGGT